MPNLNDYAIIVGIDYYVELRKLDGPINDAKDFHSWLVDCDGGRLPAKNCHCISSSENPVKPLQDDIDDKMALIYEAGKETGFNRFYFYFAGHGFGKDWKETGLCLPKWSEMRRNYALSSSLYIDAIIKSGIFKEVYFFLDCCRDRIFSVQPLSPTFGWPDSTNVAQSFAAYAAEFDNAAFEAMDLNGEKVLVRGHFTKALVQGLRGAAVNERGEVTTDSMKGYLKSTVEELAKAGNQNQTVRFVDGFTQAAVLSKPPSLKHNVTIAFNQPGDFVLEDAKINLIKTGDETTSPWTLSLDKGLYVLRNKRNQEEKFLRIDGTINSYSL